ncbi:acetylxylan esterase [Catenovulum sp. SM1970]|uniref:acetylxylan esterase n=1 Tax=Marinifaba aquimaris TaxID=2741323 RepID=UPI0015721B6C|nr:acetylxylan esterase [Marinifaba aquimaris]NTS77123.1 acetylxylan esterase [Marinifaba aquimaris]
MATPPFDASYGYTLNQLKKVTAPPAPSDFSQFWQNCYHKTLMTQPRPSITDTGRCHKNWRIFTISFHSTQNYLISGWLLLPIDSAPKRGFVIGHGYAGRDEPDFDLPFSDSALFFPCCRGISLSQHPPISPDPIWHVLHDIDKKDHYIIRGCVEDTWLAISSLLVLFPYLSGKLGYLGISFSGGVGALAMAFEQRVSKAHFNVPSFGHHRLRLKLPTWGSGDAVQRFFKQHPKMTLRTLRYYDAANAAEYINMPVHCALAKDDPVVAPPGQFAIYNALHCEKQLLVLDKGHSEYKNQAKQKKLLLNQLDKFFAELE